MLCDFECRHCFCDCNWLFEHWMFHVFKCDSLTLVFRLYLWWYESFFRRSLLCFQWLASECLQLKWSFQHLTEIQWDEIYDITVMIWFFYYHQYQSFYVFNRKMINFDSVQCIILFQYFNCIINILLHDIWLKYTEIFSEKFSNQQICFLILLCYFLICYFLCTCCFILSMSKLWDILQFWNYQQLCFKNSVIWIKTDLIFWNMTI